MILKSFSMVQPQTCGGQVQDLCFQSAELAKQNLGLESQRPGWMGYNPIRLDGANDMNFVAKTFGRPKGIS